MITKDLLGHRFTFVSTKPGEITTADLDNDFIYDIPILQVWGDKDSLFILSEKANYTFKTSEDGEDYILKRVVLIKIAKEKSSGLYLPGAEVYEL